MAAPAKRHKPQWLWTGAPKYLHSYCPAFYLVMKTRVFAFVAASSVTVRALQGAAYVEDFNDGSADNAQLLGSATINSASVLLTPDVAGQTGSLNIGLLDPAVAIQSFNVSFRLASGPGSEPPGEGFSFNFGQLPGTAFGEDGPVNFNGLTIVADLVGDGMGQPPDVELRVNGVLVPSGRSATNPFTNGAFVPVNVRLDPDGTLDLIFNNAALLTNVSTGFIPEVGDRFGFGARTDVLTAEERIDDLNITTVVPEPGTAVFLAAAFSAIALRRRR